MNLKELLFGGGVKDGGSGQGAYRDSIQAWLPIKNIIGGVAVTKDNRFIKILEVLPVNIYLKSAGDRQTIISAYGRLSENCAGQPSDGGTDHPGRTPPNMWNGCGGMPNGRKTPHAER